MRPIRTGVMAGVVVAAAVVIGGAATTDEAVDKGRVVVQGVPAEVAGDAAIEGAATIDHREAVNAGGVVQGAEAGADVVVHRVT